MLAICALKSCAVAVFVFAISFEFLSPFDCLSYSFTVAVLPFVDGFAAIFFGGTGPRLRRSI
jgi:hypothetical protein